MKPILIILLLSIFWGCRNGAEREKFISDSVHVDSLSSAEYQNKSNSLNQELDQLKAATKEIMKIMDVPIRVNITKDSPIEIVAIREWSNSLRAEAASENSVNPNDFKLRYYLNPKIYISIITMAILAGQIDTSEMITFYCKAMIMHEFCHIFSATPNPNPAKDLTSMDSLHSYVNKPFEKEAWAVQSYEFLSRFDQKSLRAIMDSKNTLDRKIELLINGMFKIYKPWRKPIF